MFIFVFFDVFLVQISCPVNFIKFFFGHFTPVFLFKTGRKRKFRVFPSQFDLTVTHGPVNEVFDFTFHWHFIALFFEHVLVERDVIGDEPEVEGKIGVLKLVAIAFFVNLIGCFLGIAFDDGVKVFETLFFVGSKFGIVKR